MSAKGTGKRRIPMTVTFLEMRAKPVVLPPPQPRGKVALLRCEKPATHFYRYLYDTIGADYYWVDRKRLSHDGLAEVIQDPLNRLYVLYIEGSPAGMAELDLRKSGAKFGGEHDQQRDHTVAEQELEQVHDHRQLQQVGDAIGQREHDDARDDVHGARALNQQKSVVDREADDPDLERIRSCQERCSNPRAQYAVLCRSCCIQLRDPLRKRRRVVGSAGRH